MKILLITIDFPLPVNAGGVARCLGISEALVAAGHEVHMLAKLREPGTPRALIDELSQRLGGAPVDVFSAGHYPPPAGKSRVAGRWAYAIATGAPPWIWTAYSRTLAARAKAIAGDFDVALLMDDHAHQFAVDLKGVIPTVLDMQNVFAASWNNTNHFGGESPSAAHKAQQALAYRLLVNWERRVTEAADAVIVTSADEAVRFKEHYSRDVDWVGSSITAPPLVADPRHAGPNVVWLGDHRYHANVSGLVRFLREGWRPLGERGLRLQVVGREPGAEVLQLASELPGVDVLGFVDDLDGLLAKASAAVVPLWKGAGIKMKTLVMMGGGLPIASTSVGMEGIAAVDGTHARLSDDPVALATAVGDLVADREGAAALGLRGRQLILDHHTWDGVIGQIEAVLARVATQRT